MLDKKFTLTNFQEDKPTFRTFTLGFIDETFNRKVAIEFTTRHCEIDEMYVDVYDGAHGMKLHSFVYSNPYSRCDQDLEDYSQKERYRNLCLEVLDCATTTLFLSEGI
jgi:hypothetical protein